MTKTMPAAVLGPGTRLTTLLRAVLGGCVVVASIVTDVRVAAFPIGIDSLIPLRAAERWVDSGAPYLREGFVDTQVLPPFLYPPFVLPLLAPLTWLPETLVRQSLAFIALLVAIAVLRRLAFAWWSIPLVILWEPMFLVVWEANVQIVLVAAFAACYWLAPARHDFRPRPREIDAPGTVTPIVGWYAATVAAVKATQLQAWISIARRSPRSAVIGALPWVAVVVVTLPIVGIPIYLDWLGTVALASDPAWWAMGPSLLKYVPGSVFMALTAASFVAALVVRGRDTGAWVGLLLLIVAPNMHDYQALFMIPAMLRIRREFALLAAFLIATATVQGWWLGIAIVGMGMLAGLRWPDAYEPSDIRAVAPA